MERVTVIRSIPDFEGAGVYALIDDTGRKYIGSSVNTKKRIMSHEISFQRVLRDGAAPNVGNKLVNAVLSGMQFDAVLLQELPNGANFYDLMDMEKRYLDENGGCKNTYNAMPIKDYRKTDYDLLRMWERESTKKASRIADGLRDLILKREQPIHYEPETVDRISFVSQKGRKAAIKAHAESMGESVNGFINRAIDEAMERDRKDGTQ